MKNSKSSPARHALGDRNRHATIAETLSDMDTEISALEGMLSKARQVKAGMMSVLLTGKIRLVNDSGKLKVQSGKLPKEGKA